MKLLVSISLVKKLGNIASQRHVASEEFSKRLRADHGPSMRAAICNNGTNQCEVDYIKIHRTEEFRKMHGKLSNEHVFRAYGIHLKRFHPIIF